MHEEAQKAKIAFIAELISAMKNTERAPIGKFTPAPRTTKTLPLDITTIPAASNVRIFSPKVRTDSELSNEKTTMSCRHSRSGSSGSE